MECRVATPGSRRGSASFSPAIACAPMAAEQADDWHRPLRHVPAAEMSTDTAQSGGMTRREAVSSKTVGSEKVWMGQAHVSAGSGSENHHHGDSETAIYVVSGHPVFVFAQDGSEVRLTPEP